MRTINFLCLLWALLFSCAAAWDKDDHEIFRIRDELIATEGLNTTFYSFVGVKPGASMDEINKAYRKTSRDLHPDKARSSFIANYASMKAKERAKAGKAPKPATTKTSKPSSRELDSFNKKANERYARLSAIGEILRGPMRDKYDFFLSNGFPAWRGTGWYYARYRPGAGVVLSGLFIVAGGLFHYGALYLSWKRQRDFVERYIRHARSMAWGNEAGVAGIPGIDDIPTANGNGTGQEAQEEPAQAWNRKEKRRMEKEARKNKGPKAAVKAKRSGVSTPVEAEITSGPQGAKKRVVAENGKVLIVDSVGNVFLEEETEDGDVQEFLLDPQEIEAPTISSTLLVRLPVYLYKQSVGRFIGGQVDPPSLSESELLNPSSSEDAMIAGATAANLNEEGRRRKGKRKN